jgi:hypothetical protein
MTCVQHFFCMCDALKNNEVISRVCGEIIFFFGAIFLNLHLSTYCAFSEDGRVNFIRLLQTGLLRVSTSQELTSCRIAQL